MKTQRIIILLMLFTVSLGAAAKQYPKVNVPLATGTVLLDLTTNSVLTAACPTDYLSIINTADVKTTYQNTVELFLKNHSDLVVDATENSEFDAKVTITADLTYFLLNNTMVGPKEIKLEVVFKSGELGKSNISNVYAFSNAGKVELKITSVAVTGGAGPASANLKLQLKDFIELSVGFQKEIISRLDHTISPTSIEACSDPRTDELVIHWSPMADAEQYELEYTFADDYGSNITPLNPVHIPFNFKDNSTRISVRENFYRFPLLFERGYILYRVRAIGAGGINLDLPVYGKWSGADHGTVAGFTDKYYHDAPHVNDKINWQVATTFAEDGKRSDVVTYMDGTFRSRQTVTGVNLEWNGISNPQGPLLAQTPCTAPGSNSIREIIAGETVYDYQGRAAVSILPVPTNAQRLEYLPELNISEVRNLPYNWEDFDKASYLCSSTNRLSSQINAHGVMGAALYYSKNNPNKLGFNAFIPDADGYPFTQVSYLQDNTGRIAAQTGLGTPFQFGGGHETRSYYAAPDQLELDRMFGTEAGDAARYQKNAVMDANGQVAVTWLNPEGKIIGTALAGNTPPNIESLDNQNDNVITVSLLNKNVINTDDKTLITEHQFLVTSDNTVYTFDYSITPETLDAAKCDNTPVCLDCIYDFEITLTHIESCTSSKLLSYSGHIGEFLAPGGNPDLECTNSDTTGNYPRQIIDTLDIGTYVITKKISVNKQAGLAYVAEVFKDTCQGKWNEFLQQEISLVDTTDCYNSCLNCSQPPVQNNNCDTAYCDPSPNRCDIIRGMLLADLSPGGQYAQFTRNPPDGSIDASAYPLSIFNPDNFLPYNVTVDLYTHIPTLQQIDIFHDYLQSFIDNHSIPYELGWTDSRKMTALINNWRPEFAEALIKLHPEACLLGWCGLTEIKATLDFDVQILTAQYFADAETKGYIVKGMPQVYLKLLDSDPWFSYPVTSSLKTQLTEKLADMGCDPDHPVPADLLAMQMAYCYKTNPPQEPTQNAAGTSMDLIPEPAINLDGTQCILPTNYHTFGTDTVYANLEWRYLRSFYLSAKNQIIEESMKDFSTNYPCNTDCIDRNFFISWSNSFIQPAPCNSFLSHFLYADKDRRFITGLNKILDAMEQANIPINLMNVPDDPCSIAQAIANQSGSINQDFASNICGQDSAHPCDLTTNLLIVLNGMIAQLNDSTSNVNYPNVPPPINILSPEITGITMTNFPPNSIRILIQPCGKPFSIPYLTASGGNIAPVSLCCIDNIVCTEGVGCAFSIQVTYANGITKIIQIESKCDYLENCVPDTVYPCPKPSEYAWAVKDYLNDILHFIAAYNHPPTSAQLINLLPDYLRKKSDILAESVTVNTSSNFVVSINYANPGPIVPRNNRCDIVLQSPPGLNNWNKVKHILSIQPDLSLAAQNDITNAFILKALEENSSVISAITVKGSSTCWPMNQCPPAITLCDSIRLLPAHHEKNDCVEALMATAYSNASLLYQSWIDSTKNDLLNRYYTKCLAAVEHFTVSYTDKQYQYTLYYYDQAGNVAKTVPPSGVRLLNPAEASQVETSRANNYNTAVLPAHIKTTVYQYNTLNQPVRQRTPDAGKSEFYYDGLGRIAASQNAQQYNDHAFSYVRYDKLGRIFESGKVQTTGIDASRTHNWAAWDNYIKAQAARTEITYTKYDEPYSAQVSQKFGTAGQRNLRNRVSSVFSFPDKTRYAAGKYTHATHYTYDIQGNVYKLIQDYPNGFIGDKILEYDYDLQSGKVNSVTYQRGAPDQFMHKYSYDALNRLIRVKTSPDGLLWETDAEYFYYRHGMLGRMELATDKVQGLDYLYTLQGWIKGVNGAAITPETDMGQDGIINPPGQAGTQTQTGPQVITINGHTVNIYTAAQLYGTGFNGPGYGALHNKVARDAFGYVLDYFKGDYFPINDHACLAALQQHTGTSKDLYNGNISRMYTQLQKLGNTGFNYSYDQLNRIKSQEGWQLSAVGNSFVMNSLPGDGYGMKLSYDADGNIKTLDRNGRKGTGMDNLKYFYYTQAGAIYDPVTGIPDNASNRLAYVKDDPGLSANYPETNPLNGTVTDIDNQLPDNYKYDLIGNLTGDASENIDGIVWNLQNKVSKITKTDGTAISYGYDALGNRVMKAVSGGTLPNVTTYYARDAQGIIIATYEAKEEKLYWSEQVLYGSSRLGIFRPAIAIPKVVTTSGPPTATSGTLAPAFTGQVAQATSLSGGSGIIQAAPFVLRNDNLFGGIMYQNQMAAPMTPVPLSQPAGAYFTATRGYKDYELSNHLGNVLASVTDRKLPQINNEAVENYTADVSGSQDYYPFGMEMPGRKFSSDKYKFGFNGKLNDNEVYGEGNFQDYGFRMYDTRIARFISIDSKFKDSPNMSSYSGFNNNPVLFKDPSGQTGVASIIMANGEQVIQVEVHLIFYGDGIGAVDPQKVTSKMQDSWNNVSNTVTNPDGTTKSTIGPGIVTLSNTQQNANGCTIQEKIDYKVIFKVTYEVSSKTKDELVQEAGATSTPAENNYIEIKEGKGMSGVFGDKNAIYRNKAEYFTENSYEQDLEYSTTAAHEFGHLLGIIQSSKFIKKPTGEIRVPNIMQHKCPYGMLKELFHEIRNVQQSNIRALNLEELLKGKKLGEKVKIGERKKID